MSRIGVDVSSYQGNINWKKVKDSGIDFSILKIIRKDLNSDKQFENNWKGCQSAGVEIQGVYNYSYATTAEKARTDARKIIEILNGRKTMVWLDVEDNCQTKLGANLVFLINAYKDIIKSAGLRFGVYTGVYFYENYIKPYGGIKCPMWIARYGKNTGEMDLRYKPKFGNMIGWQYTSKGTVTGISGNVDMNVWYEDLKREENSDNNFKINPYPEPTRLIYKKNNMMRGEDVKWLQWELIRHKCLAEYNRKGKNNIDGILGNDTSNAIYAFQRKAKISVDGKCGPVTRAYLKE